MSDSAVVSLPPLERPAAAVLASVAGDALSLGPHWLYDPERIRMDFGPPEEIGQTLTTPPKDSHHKHRTAGQHTHYGEQMLVLLESVAARDGFDLDDFAARWRELFTDYNGYMDGATRQTLAGFAEGNGPQTAGSHSGDFSGAARIAPLVWKYSTDEKALLQAVEAQTRMTHDNPQVTEAASYLARLAVAILQGENPREAAAELTGTLTSLREGAEKALTTATRDTVETIGRFGQNCSVKSAFPGFLHLLARFEDDLYTGMRHNLSAGGDSAARNLALGLIAGAHHGAEAIPQAWLAPMHSREKVLELLSG